MFDEFTRTLERRKIETNLTTITAAEAKSIRAEFPDIPEAYVEFLRTVGWGQLGS
jgi:hypothetical protein